jgi:hypothetical protein
VVLLEGLAPPVDALCFTDRAGGGSLEMKRSRKRYALLNSDTSVVCIFRPRPALLQSIRTARVVHNGKWCGGIIRPLPARAHLLNTYIAGEQSSRATAPSPREHRQTNTRNSGTQEL